MGIDWSPLLEAPWFIQWHAFAALAGLMLGTVQFVAPKGTLPHKLLGFVWIILLTIVTVTSYLTIFMFEVVRFSPIHVLSAVTTVGLIAGVTLLFRKGPEFKRHGRSFFLIYVFGLVVTGGFTLMPGRIMHDVVFG